MEIYGETMETVKDFIFLGSKISADSDCSHEIKKCCSWKKSYDHTMRHYFANKACSSQSYVFLVVMYGCESWTVKKAEHQRIDAFELWFGEDS